MTSKRQRWAGITAIVVGIGLAAAPAMFQMYDRAPMGGDMIDEFEPYMSQEVISEFRGYLDVVDAANADAATVQAELLALGDPAAADFATTYPQVAAIEEQWPDIQADMTDLLDRMERNLDNYAAVAALPSFDLFPFFFVIPGGLMAIAGITVLVLGRRGRSTRAALWVLVALGLGMVAAPAVFQMFTRAPKGAEMIDDFTPMMTEDRLRAVQGYFITLGGAEGQMRVALLPGLEAAGGDPAAHTAIADFSAQWQPMLVDFNGMVATMSDNLDNFEAVAALPSFDLFPWFFVIPGLLVAVTAIVALRRPKQPGPESPTTTGGTSP